MSELKSIKDLTLELLKDTFDAEHQLLEALPRLIGATSHGGLKRAFKNHLSETHNHVTRLQKAFKILNEKAERERCMGMAGLIKEGDQAGQKHGDPALVDAAIISASQKCEHYEIVAYGTLRTYAEKMGRADLAELFQTTLDEEKNADGILSDIADGELIEDSRKHSDEHEADAQEVPAPKSKPAKMAKPAANAKASKNAKAPKSTKSAAKAKPAKNVQGKKPSKLTKAEKNKKTTVRSGKGDASSKK